MGTIVKNTKMRKRTFMGLLSFLMLLSVMFPVGGGGTTFANELSGMNTDYKIVGYYPSWAAYGREYNVSDIDGSKVTHINYAFADICWNGRHGNADPEGPNPQTWPCRNADEQTINVPNGTVVLGDPWIDAGKRFTGDTWDQPYAGNLNQLSKLKEQHPHLKTIISIGGWTWSNRFSDVAATQETREVFAQSAVDFIRTYNMDGVDLDWEYPVSGGLPGNSRRPEDKQNHTLLLQEVRKALDIAEQEDGKTYLLTIASGASPTYAENNELDKIAEVVDFINIMTYDFNGGWQTVSAHNAPLFYDEAALTAGVPQAEVYYVDAGVQGHLEKGVPPEKLVLGVPFYGRSWGNCSNGRNGEYQNCGRATGGTWENGVYDFTDLENNFINKNGYTRHWNDVAKVPYLYNPSTGEFISYDDEQSMAYKTAYIQNLGLGGAMFWEFSGDRNNTLLTQVHNDLFDGQTPPAPEPGNPTEPTDPTDPPEPEPPSQCEAPAWSSTQVYTGGAEVSHNGSIWRAGWWTLGEEPGTTGEWGVWRYVSGCLTP